MTVEETPIPGCFEIRPKILRDDRGGFIKTFHTDAFAKQGLCTEWREEYYSVSKRGVLRGLHFQTPPHDHAKLVYCVDGAVLDAVVDLRKGSPTYGMHKTFELTAEGAGMLYIPGGLAHGFFVLSESATMMYKVSTVYAPEHDRGIRWDSAGIPWPVQAPILSPRDAVLPVLDDFDSPFS